MIIVKYKYVKEFFVTDGKVEHHMGAKSLNDVDRLGSVNQITD